MWNSFLQTPPVALRHKEFSRVTYGHDDQVRGETRRPELMCKNSLTCVCTFLDSVIFVYVYTWGWPDTKSFLLRSSPRYVTHHRGSLGSLRVSPTCLVGVTLPTATFSLASLPSLLLLQDWPSPKTGRPSSQYYFHTYVLQEEKYVIETSGCQLGATFLLGRPRVDNNMPGVLVYDINTRVEWTTTSHFTWCKESVVPRRHSRYGVGDGNMTYCEFTSFG